MPLLLGKDEVTGSNPVSSSIKMRHIFVSYFLCKLIPIFEQVTESKDEARRVKKTVRWTVFSRAGSNPVSSSIKMRHIFVSYFLCKPAPIFEQVTESKDEARRVKKTVRWTVFSRAGSNPVSSSRRETTRYCGFSHFYPLKTTTQS